MLKTYRFFWLITIIIILLFITSAFVVEGMFFDGIIYSSIARNLANGVGNFWQPVYMGDVFYEHPPLVFGLQSLFFKILGQGIYTEKIYSALVFILTAYLIIKTWKRLFKEEKEIRNYSWLPVLCWCVIPRVMFAYPNNLLDTSMALLDLLAFYFCMKAIYASGKKWFYFTIAGIFVFLAFFAKGPVGLFPLAIPFIYYPVYNRNKIWQGALLSLYIAFVSGLIFWLMLQYKPANNFFRVYFDKQLIDSFLGNREKVKSVIGNFQIFVWLLMYLSPLFIFVIAGRLFLKAKKHDFTLQAGHKKLFIFLLLIAISASFPIAFSAKQRAFYLIPAFIFYAFAFAVLLIPIIKILVSATPAFIKFRDKTYLLLQLAFAISIFYNIYLFGKTGRDELVIYNTKLLTEKIGFGGKIGICLAIYEDWQLKAYLERYGHIATSDLYKNPQYYLYTEKCDSDYTNKIKRGNYTKVTLPLKGLILYERIQD